MSYKCSICQQNYTFFQNAESCCPTGQAVYYSNMFNNWSTPDYVKTVYDEEYQGQLEDKHYD